MRTYHATYIFLSPYLRMYVCMYVTTYLLICLSPCLYTYLFFYLSTHLFIHPSMYVHVYIKYSFVVSEGEYIKVSNGSIQRHGTGTHHSKDGSVYSGCWLNDVMCGQGEIKHANGSTYKVWYCV